MSNSVASASPSRCGTAAMSPGRVQSPKQWQESLFEDNFRPVPIVENTKRAASAPPQNFEQMTFLEKLMYTGKSSPSRLKTQSPSKPGGTFKLEVISPEKQKKTISYGHETNVVMVPSKSHVEAFRSGLESTPPLKIIKHVKVGVKLPKMSSGNTPSNICRNYAGGFYATS